MPYPPGVSAGTKSAPWNEKPAPECRDCLEVIHDIDDHKEWCEFQDTSEEIHERQAYGRNL